MTSPGSLAMLGTVLVLMLMLGLACALPALGAEPSPSAEAVFEGGDPRSEGEGPGIVGSPLLILVAVVALGAATAGVTLIAVRLGQRD